MAKLHFNYATMNAGKSIDLIRTAYNYEGNGFKVLVLKPKLDTKDGNYVSSRAGLRRKVDELYLITKALDIPVITYGLKLNFKGEMFEGSKRLMELGEELSEIPTICSCGEIAQMVGRKVNGEFTLDGAEVVIDGSSDTVEYIPLWVNVI